MKRFNNTQPRQIRYMHCKLKPDHSFVWGKLKWIPLMLTYRPEHEPTFSFSYNTVADMCWLIINNG